MLCLLLYCAALLACSTPISPYAQIEDEDDEDDEDDLDPPSDAGRSPDGGGTPRDASVPPGRDAGSDAGRDAGILPIPAECTRLPAGGFANVFTDGCGQRMRIPCGIPPRPNNQQGLNDRLASLASGCRVPANTNIGIAINEAGCPTHLFFDSRAVLGAISSCLTAALESQRFDCNARCASSGPSTR